jgi:putative phage-type endonuclease
MRVVSPQPGSTEWLTLRRSGLGATDAAVVAGRSRFSGPFDKYQEMRGTSAPKIATEAMQWGIILERPVGLEWARRTGKKVRHVGYTYFLEPGIFSHFDFDVVDEDAILEVKTASAYGQREWGEQDTDQIPEEYLLQAQHEIACRGPEIKRCYLAVLIGGQKFQKYVVERDDELIGNLLTIERKFLDDTDAGIPPTIDGTDACSEYLRSRFPKDDGSLLALPERVESDALAYLAVMAEEKDVAERKALIGNRLRSALEAASGGSGKDVRVTYRAQRDRIETDWKALAATLSARTLKRFTTTKQGNRPLIVSFIGDA